MEPADIARSRSDTSRGHILIGGPGRSGTTLLVQYFTALGFETGYDLEQALTKVDPISGGGLEHSLGRTLGRGAPMPYVAKSPYFGRKLGDYIAGGELQVGACIIAMRDLHDAAASRLHASERARLAGRDPTAQPGGARGLQDAKLQRRRLAVRFYELASVLAQHDVPVHLLWFPAFASDPAVLYRGLQPLLEEHGVTPDESAAALARVVDLSLVHTFS